MEIITLNLVRDCLEAYASDLHLIASLEKEEWQRQADAARQNLIGCMEIMRDLFPELFQFNLPDYLPDDEAQKLRDRLHTNAGRRFSLDFLPTANHFVDIINGNRIETPAFVSWQDENNPLQNFVISYNGHQKKDAQTAMQTLVMDMLIGLPAKKVLLNIFDFDMTGMCDMFSTNLDPMLYHDEIVYNEETANIRLKGLLEHMTTVMKKYGNLVAWNNRHREIALPYEVIILNNYPHGFENYMQQLMPLFENGPRCGIYFIILHNSECLLRNKEEKQLLDLDNYQNIDLPNAGDKDALVCHTPISKIPLLANVCFDYLREECTRIPKRTILKKDFSAVANASYEPVMSEISVTIGLDIENRKEVTLRFNSGDYIHAFILGQSGSGKSVLLNNIITSAINKYAPEDLMLYLMDFKGVEFNRYRGIRHAKAVLVDNSDPQMTLEILRELKEENRRRVKLWQAEGVNNIDGYNRKHPDKRIPQVLFVADECQVMFSKPDGRPSSYEIQREIAAILNIIATQGRSQGIHMLLATQTLDDTDISGQILKNLTECFLLMCAPSDSNILVPDSGDMTVKQPTGQCCYYHKKELVSQVQTFYAKDEELETAITASQEKASGHTSNGGAYFRGSSMFSLDETEKGSIAALSKNEPMAVVGHNVGLKGNLTSIKLRRDFSENILFFGINKEEQTVGVTINALMSLVISYRQLGKTCDFMVIDCLNREEGKYRSILEAMQTNGLCRLVERTQSGILLQQLVDDICHQCATPTVLAIIGSERFAEMKRKSPLPSRQKSDDFDPANDVISMDFGEMGDLFGDSGNYLDASRVKTYPDALKFILDEGPMQGIHVLLQVDKPENILFEGEYCTDATDKFHHKVILRTENKYLAPMRFSTDIDVESLGEDEERLRAYYYPEDGEPQLFTPYLMPKSKKIINTLTITTTITWEQQIVQ